MHGICHALNFLPHDMPYPKESMGTVPDRSPAPNWQRKLVAYLAALSPWRNSAAADLAQTIDEFVAAAGAATAESLENLYAERATWEGTAYRFPRTVVGGAPGSFVHPLSDRSAQSLWGSPSAVQDVNTLIAETFKGFRVDVRSAGADDAWRDLFFAVWRFLPDQEPQLRSCPADDSHADESCWTQAGIRSAIAGCRDEATGEITPAFLKVQIGPVQDFIAQARSTRDLWSGSYLLSWLMAAGLKALSARIGPDAVVYPSVRGQPLFDLHWRDDLWKKVQVGGELAWEKLAALHDPQKRVLLTPNLPHVLVAVVSAAQGRALGETVEQAIREEWRRVAEAVWTFCAESGPDSPNLTSRHVMLAPAGLRARFDSQIEHHLSVSWRVTPWPETFAEVERWLGQPETFPNLEIENLRRELLAATNDYRQANGNEPPPSLGWSAIYHRNDWELNAVRATRVFAPGSERIDDAGPSYTRDFLSGKEEHVADGGVWREAVNEFLDARVSSDEFQRRHNRFGRLRFRFKEGHNDKLGAVTLVKRLWDHCYLAGEDYPWRLPAVPKEYPKPSGFVMPSTRAIANFAPDENDDRPGDETEADEKPDEQSYFAVLALDGDEIGKWLSGTKTPRRDPSDEHSSRHPVSHAYHQLFSEALGNFALRCARPIVEHCAGRLIYAGGDDVLALLPAGIAVVCAEALRYAFRGDAEALKEALDRARAIIPERARASVATFVRPLEATGCGFLQSGERVGDAASPPASPPFLVPGPSAEVSVGIAIAHYTLPLQDAIRAAQDAERRAKNQGGRAAVAIACHKRSGETFHWGSRWELPTLDSSGRPREPKESSTIRGGLAVLDALSSAMARGVIGARFPHVLLERLEKYCTPEVAFARRAIADAPDFDVRQVLDLEFAFALRRQARDPAEIAWKDLQDSLLGGAGLLRPYLDHLASSGGGGGGPANPPAASATQRVLQSCMGLLRTLGFIHVHARSATSTARPDAAATS